MAAEKMLAAAMLVAPYAADETADPEGQVVDENLPPLTAHMTELLAKRGNPFTQKLAVVDKLGRAAARLADSIEDQPKAKRTSVAASRKLQVLSGDPELRKLELLFGIKEGVRRMGVNPETYFHDLARRLRVPLFDSPEKLELALINRVARMVYRDEQAEA